MKTKILNVSFIDICPISWQRAFLVAFLFIITKNTFANEVKPNTSIVIPNGKSYEFSQCTHKSDCTKELISLGTHNMIKVLNDYKKKGIAQWQVRVLESNIVEDLTHIDENLYLELERNYKFIDETPMQYFYLKKFNDQIRENPLDDIKTIADNIINHTNTKTSDRIKEHIVYQYLSSSDRTIKDADRVEQAVAYVSKNNLDNQRSYLRSIQDYDTLYKVSLSFNHRDEIDTNELICTKLESDFQAMLDSYDYCSDKDECMGFYDGGASPILESKIYQEELGLTCNEMSVKEFISKNLSNARYHLIEYFNDENPPEDEKTQELTECTHCLDLNEKYIIKSKELEMNGKVIKAVIGYTKECKNSKYFFKEDDSFFNNHIKLWSKRRVNGIAEHKNYSKEGSCEKFIETRMKNSLTKNE